MIVCDRDELLGSGQQDVYTTEVEALQRLVLQTT